MRASSVDASATYVAPERTVQQDYLKAAPKQNGASKGNGAGAGGTAAQDAVFLTMIADEDKGPAPAAAAAAAPAAVSIDPALLARLAAKKDVQ